MYIYIHIPLYPDYGSSLTLDEGPKDHINIRILRSGSEAQDKGEPRNHDSQYPHVSVPLFKSPNSDALLGFDVSPRTTTAQAASPATHPLMQPAVGEARHLVQAIQGPGRFL